MSNTSQGPTNLSGVRDLVLVKVEDGNDRDHDMVVKRTDKSTTQSRRRALKECQNHSSNGSSVPETKDEFKKLFYFSIPVSGFPFTRKLEGSYKGGSLNRLPKPKRMWKTDTQLRHIW
jgi:hypothetical protein